MNNDTRAFVPARCASCAGSKSTHHQPASLLSTLPVPWCPWSHITVDFVTGLPPSEGNTTILTIGDRFSKTVYFVPLPKILFALETANLLVLHVFQLHGIPQDIVSDGGPQFTSQVWKAFCRALGTTASLSSGYHPQTNGVMESANQDLESALCSIPSPPALPQVCHHSLFARVFNLQTFLLRKIKWLSRPSSCTYAIADGSGKLPEPPSVEPPPKTGGLLTTTTPRLPPTNQCSMCLCLSPSPPAL